MLLAIRSRGKGLSLIESVVAIYLLVGVCLLMALLFHSSLAYGGRVVRMQTATQIAENTLAQVRAWAKDPSHFATWSGPYPWEATAPPPYQVIVAQSMQTVASPCSQTEKVFGDNQRSLFQSYRKVTVSVRWTNQPNDVVRLTSLIGDPPRGLAPLSQRLTLTAQSPVPNPIPPRGKIVFKAQLWDSGLVEIPDVFFSQVILAPIDLDPGNAVIDVNDLATRRTGITAVLWNYYPDVDGWSSISGSVELRATARYRGIPLENTVPVVVRLGP